jgi:tetracycline 7-halogenase / FADH2 O2-dependent halogenase
MTEIDADIAILGSGFGGSMTALLLERVGLRPVLIDRRSHPRFAIGESSTPVADYVLRDLARRYNLPRLEPLAKYGTWQAAYPKLVCGPKRGFSYFRHEPGRPFAPRGDHANELLVAASSDDFHADTHWLRSDVDSFLASEAVAAGIPYFDQAEVSLTPGDSGWVLTGLRHEEPLRIRAPFVIDATGEAGVVLRTLGISSDLPRLATHSRTIYSHFEGLSPWHESLVAAGGCVDDHPFYCDHAALHHVLEEGWMWQLRFNNGITSAGFVLDEAAHPLDGSRSAAEEWSALLRRYPSVAGQFEKSRIVEPPGAILRTGRLQRLAARIAGKNWALLPNAAGFIDPLHSTGIAQTLCGIERLVRILGENWNKPGLPDKLHEYETIVRQEITLIDKLVSGCYLARRNARLFASFSMFYFAAATTYEHRRHSGALPSGAAFLCADDPVFRQVIEEVWHSVRVLANSPLLAESQIVPFEAQVAEAIGPYNRVGLCDQQVRNMYRFTAAPH